MKINFTQVLQDSWHFFRNQQKIMLQLVFMLFIVQVLSVLLTPDFMAQDTVSGGNTLSDLGQINASDFLASFLPAQLASIFISAWGLMTIHQISRHNPLTLSTNFVLTLRRFIGVIVLETVSVLPVLIGVAHIVGVALSNTAPSIAALLTIFFGIYFFIRLNLASLHYLTTQDGIGQSLQKIWLQGRNQKTALLIYALLVYFVAPMLILQLSVLSENLIFSVIVSLTAALINIFTLVVTYRFYSLFMQEP